MTLHACTSKDNHYNSTEKVISAAIQNNPGSRLALKDNSTDSFNINRYDGTIRLESRLNSGEDHA